MGVMGVNDMDESPKTAVFEEERPGFLLSTDRSKLNVEVIYRYLADESYWWQPEDISPEKVARFICYSLCFGVYAVDGDVTQQIGFARAVTDYTTYSYLADVFIMPAWQGQGLGKWMITALVKHVEMQGLRRWSLSTGDAHGLYKPFGFEVDDKPEKNMSYHPRNSSITAVFS